jgi:hypothetical protein
MLADLKKLLAECHAKSDDKLIKAWGENTIEYLIQRAKEELDIEGPERAARLKRVIQILNIARFKILKEVTDVNSVFGGRSRKLTDRELTNKFLDLPYVIIAAIGTEIGAINQETDKPLPTKDLCTQILIYCKASNKIEILEQKILNAHAERQR